MTSAGETVEDEKSGLRRAIVLMLLDARGGPRPRAELFAALPSSDSAELNEALSDLERAGVVELGEDEVRASPATRMLDGLHLIGI